jgi:hypothetical protein
LSEWKSIEDGAAATTAGELAAKFRRHLSRSHRDDARNDQSLGPSWLKGCELALP